MNINSDPLMSWIGANNSYLSWEFIKYFRPFWKISIRKTMVGNILYSKLPALPEFFFIFVVLTLSNIYNGAFEQNLSTVIRR